MQAEAWAELELLHGETLGRAENGFPESLEFAGTNLAVPVPGSNRHELNVEDVAWLQGAGFRVVDKTGGLRLAIGVEVEPLVFIGIGVNCLLEPIPVKVLD